MDMIARKKRIMMMQPSATELYPVGTGIIDIYIRQADGWQAGYIVDASGEFKPGTTADYYASSIYIPVDPSYTYRKNAYRLGNNSGGYVAWYDANKEFISSFRQDNLTIGDIPNPPNNAAYMRVSTRNLSNTRSVEIVRAS